MLFTMQQLCSSLVPRPPPLLPSLCAHNSTVYCTVIYYCECKWSGRPAKNRLAVYYCQCKQGRLGNEANYVVSEMSNCDACILFAIAIIHEYGVLVWE